MHWEAWKKECNQIMRAERRKCFFTGRTSPLASSVFMRSKKPESSTFDSSMMKAIFSFLQPERRRTVRRSSSKSSPVYLRWTCEDTIRYKSPNHHQTGATIISPFQPWSDRHSVRSSRPRSGRAWSSQRRWRRSGAGDPAADGRFWGRASFTFSHVWPSSQSSTGILRIHCMGHNWSCYAKNH